MIIALQKCIFIHLNRSVSPGNYYIIIGIGSDNKDNLKCESKLLLTGVAGQAGKMASRRAAKSPAKISR